MSHWHFREVGCPGCGSDRARFAGWRGGDAHVRGLGQKTRIVRCRDCGLLYPNPTPFPTDHSHYSDAEAYFASKEDAATRIEGFRRLMRETADYGGVPPLLDIGCGRGEALVAARDLGWEARGIEPSPEFAKAGAEAFDVEIEVGTFADQHPPDSFGLVLLAGVLEHVYDPGDMVRRVHRVLRPGGLIVIDVPNEQSLMHYLARAAFLATGRNWTLSLAPTFEPFHVNGFSARSLSHTLRGGGFEPVKMKGYPMRWIGGRVGYAVERVTAPRRLSAGLLAWGRKV
jgi:SAM-dependent methyltransferase